MLQFNNNKVCVGGGMLPQVKRSSDIWRELRVEPLLTFKKSQLEWPGKLIKILLGANWEATQNSLERLHISSGPGTPRDPPGGAGKRCWGEKHLEQPAEPAAAVTDPRSAYEDGWMDLER